MNLAVMSTGMKTHPLHSLIHDRVSNSLKNPYLPRIFCRPTFHPSFGFHGPTSCTQHVRYTAYLSEVSALTTYPSSNTLRRGRKRNSYKKGTGSSHFAGLPLCSNQPARTRQRRLIVHCAAAIVASQTSYPRAIASYPNIQHSKQRTNSLRQNRTRPSASSGLIALHRTHQRPLQPPSTTYSE